MATFNPATFNPATFNTDSVSATATGLAPLPGIDMSSMLALVKGSDYSTSDSRAVHFTQSEFTAETWPELTGATVTLRLDIAGVVTTITGTVTTATGGSKQVRFALTAVQTAAAGSGRFDVRATISARVVTLRQGPVRIYSNL